jgi:hypothetical protein
MSSEGALRGKRIEGLCEIIWGDCNYDLDLETDDWVTYTVAVRREFGTSFGPLLTMTGFCNSEDRAWNELERMLSLWAIQVQSGQPMTKARRLDIFSGPNGEHRNLLEQVEKYHPERERGG